MSLRSLQSRTTGLEVRLSKGLELGGERFYSARPQCPVGQWVYEHWAQRAPYWPDSSRRGRRLWWRGGLQGVEEELPPLV